MPGGSAAGRRVWRRYAWVYILALVTLVALVGCGSGPLDPPPPAGFAVGNAMGDAATALDHRKNGPNAYLYDVDVGARTGQNRLLMYYILNNTLGVPDGAPF